MEIDDAELGHRCAEPDRARQSRVRLQGRCAVGRAGELRGRKPGAARQVEEGHHRAVLDCRLGRRDARRAHDDASAQGEDGGNPVGQADVDLRHRARRDREEPAGPRDHVPRQRPVPRPVEDAPAARDTRQALQGFRARRPARPDLRERRDRRLQRRQGELHLVPRRQHPLREAHHVRGRSEARRHGSESIPSISIPRSTTSSSSRAIRRTRRTTRSALTCRTSATSVRSGRVEQTSRDRHRQPFREAACPCASAMLEAVFPSSDAIAGSAP